MTCYYFLAINFFQLQKINARNSCYLFNLSRHSSSNQQPVWGKTCLHSCSFHHISNICFPAVLPFTSILNSKKKEPDIFWASHAITQICVIHVESTICWVIEIFFPRKEKKRKFLISGARNTRGRVVWKRVRRLIDDHCTQTNVSSTGGNIMISSYRCTQILNSQNHIELMPFLQHAHFPS